MDYIHTLLISEDDLNDQVEEISGEVREQQGLSEGGAGEGCQASQQQGADSTVEGAVN